LPVDNAGNSLSAAKNLILTTTPTTQSDWVGALDTKDFYRFSFSSYSSLSLKYYGTTAPIGLQLIQDKNNNNTIDTGEILTSITLNANYIGTYQPNLDSGTYFLGVSPGTSTAETNYKVDLSAKAVNAAPDALQFSLASTTVNWSDKLTINSGYVRDQNGFGDLAKVDFKIKRGDGTFIDVADAIAFTPYSADPKFGVFNYTLDLSSYKLTGGNYTLWSQASDKAGLLSTIVQKNFTITPNAAPTLQFGLDNTVIQTNDNLLTVQNGLAIDTNGGTDISRVAFKVRRSDGTFIAVSDATGLVATGTQASFNYRLDLTGLGLAAGSYKLVGQAFDRFGASSAAIEKDFTLVNPIVNDAGNTIKTAEVRSSAAFTRTDSVNSIDRNDFYRFTVNQTGVFTAMLSGMTADADVRLIQDANNNGIVDQGEVQAWQWERGSTAESIRKFLTAGSYVLEVMSYNKQATNYTLATNFVAAATDNLKFSISVNFLASASALNQTLKNAVVQAAQFWESVISASPTNAAYNLAIDVGGTVQAWANGAGTLASAGPSGISYDSAGFWKLPTKGTANINTNTEAIAALTSTVDYFKSVMIHEFGHILGLGTYWGAKPGKALVDTTTGVYRANTYAGSVYGELKGTFVQTAIPVTTGVGPGSDYAHWREDVFQTEIMTHLANQGKKMPVSQLTIAALRDLGWSVNYGAAEVYKLPA
jgi:hypothetical protein